jgi:hypothetical protein
MRSLAVLLGMTGCLGGIHAPTANHASDLGDGGVVVDSAVAITAPADLSAVATRPTKPIYVVAGDDARRLVSFDGSVYTGDVYSMPGAGSLTGIAMGAGMIVAVGDAGIFTSSDGLTWAMTTQPMGQSFHTAQITYGGGRFVFVANDLSYTSADGITWQSNLQNNADGAHWNGIAYGTDASGVGHYFAVGDLGQGMPGCRKRSEDGLTWEDYVTVGDPFADVAYGDGRFVVVGQTTMSGATVGHSAVSMDGGATITADTYPTLKYATGWGGLAYDGTKFITSDCCDTYTSPDGIAWTKRGLGWNRGKLTFAGGRCVAETFPATISISADCTNFAAIVDDSHQMSMYNDGGAPGFSTIGAGEIYQ